MSQPDSIELKSLLKEIGENWGKVLAPAANRSQWDADLAIEFANHSVWNFSDFNYGKCHSYVILAQPGTYACPGSRAEDQVLTKQLGGQQLHVILELSVVLPFYRAWLSRRTYDSEGLATDCVVDISKDEYGLLQQAHVFARRRGFIRVGDELITALVPGVELDLAEPGTVSIYNCLFEDRSNCLPPGGLQNSTGA